MAGLALILFERGVSWSLWLLILTALVAAPVLWVYSARMIANYQRSLLKLTNSTSEETFRKDG